MTDAPAPDDDPVTSALRRIQVAHLQVRADLRDAAAEIERLRAQITADALAYAAVVRERNEAWMRGAEREARLAEAVEVLRGLMEWAEPLAGDNCDPLAASEETRSVEFARAFLARMETASD